MRILRIAFLGLILVSSTVLEGYGQVRNKDGSIDCTEPTVVQVSQKSIRLISTSDYALAVGGDHVVYYKESDKYTFWYKIVVDHSCYLRFDILPSSKSDFYNFYIYKYGGSNFCKAVIDNSLVAFNANLFEEVGANKWNDINSGIMGIKKEAGPLDEYVYHKPRQRIIEVEAGQEYYLNVHHFVGDDCGHTIEFSTYEASLTIKAKHRPCYEPTVDPIPVIEALEKLKALTSIASIASAPLLPLDLEEHLLPIKARVDEVSQDKRKAFQVVSLNPAVFDIRSESPMEVEFEIIESASGRHVMQRKSSEGRVEVELRSDLEYKIVYSSLGYESKEIELQHGESKQLELERVFLKPKAVGTNIVLRNIYFHPNTYVFRNGAKTELGRLLNFLQGNESARIEIQGHTNGDYRVKSQSQYAHLGKGWNFQGSSTKLSKLRASEVRDFLTDNGIDSNRLIVTGLGGQHMLIKDPDDYEDRLVNMRVEIVILEI